ncbi:prepilin-type N-terminal cleavage/methylation domain-containing protein [Hydrogenophaga borbori]|uniref:Prepilin-type N-terminal cleavage/methylation domain-containing protein n=1 Tax=Hydrogenophaga borbori TaxID=2294117 RepID=A0A372EMU5_9BURK|nr:PilW family protein [Hydrogenophaga borbori]RFP80940.1 prepilin-type N-terminal cleavage/methylation domain-containing protein [Hydrogenophaga borbori]
MKRPARPWRAAHQCGFTLVELMVALALGLFLVGVVGFTYLQAAGGTRFGALESQMNEEAALALDTLRSQLRLAGYSDTGADGRRLLKESPLRGCDGGFTSATETGTFDSLACQGGGGNDAIALRFQATAFNTQMVGSGTALPANCTNVGIAATVLAPQVEPWFADNRFYIATDPRNDNTPTLYCRGSDGPGSFSAAAALVPNVESLQLRYAITRRPTAGEVPPHQVTALVSASDLPPGDEWARVAAVELCLVVRSARAVPRDGLSMNDTTRHIGCDGSAHTATDGRLRRAYRTLVPLPNVRPALPQPYDASAGAVANPYRDLNTSP